MAKVTLPTVTGTNNISTINANFQALAAELNNKALYRDVPDGEPNQMENSLDMNSNRILNLPKPISPLEPVRRIDVVDTSTVSSEIIAQAVTDSSANALAAQQASAAAQNASTTAAGYAQDAYDNSRLTVGTVTTGAPGTAAAVSINGAPGSQIIDFTIPRGGSGTGGGDKIRIVVIGDSMSARQAMLDEIWPDTLQSNLNAAGMEAEVFSLAVNGATHFSALNTPVYGGLSQVARCAELLPDLVIVALGINDGYRANSVGLSQVITETAALYNAVHAGSPAATVVYASETFYDKTHGSPSTLTNEQSLPIFANRRTSGLLNNMLCPDIMTEAASTDHRNATSNWEIIDATIRTYGIPWFELPVWQAVRLGLAMSDGFHINYQGHRFVSAAAFKWCKSYTALFPKLGIQGVNSWNDWSVAFNALLESNGFRFINKAVSPSDASVVTYWGPWSSAVREKWFTYSKASVSYDIYGNSYVKRQNVWGFSIVGALPGAEVFQSSNETTWQSLGRADSRGNFKYSIVLEGLGIPNGSYTHRVRVDNDVTSRFDYIVSGTGYITDSNIPLTSLAQGGASSGQVLAWNGSAWSPSAAGGAKAYFLAAGSTSAVAPVRGSHVPVNVAGSSSNNGAFTMVS